MIPFPGDFFGDVSKAFLNPGRAICNTGRCWDLLGLFGPSIGPGERKSPIRDLVGVLLTEVLPHGVDGNSELAPPLPENRSFVALEGTGLFRFLPEYVGFLSEASISCCWRDRMGCQPQRRPRRLVETQHTLKVNWVFILSISSRVSFWICAWVASAASLAALRRFTLVLCSSVSYTSET